MVTCVQKAPEAWLSCGSPSHGSPVALSKNRLCGRDASTTTSLTARAKQGVGNGSGGSPPSIRIPRPHTHSGKLGMDRDLHSNGLPNVSSPHGAGGGGTRQEEGGRGRRRGEGAGRGGTGQEEEGGHGRQRGYGHPQVSWAHEQVA